MQLYNGCVEIVIYLKEKLTFKKYYYYKMKCLVTLVEAKEVARKLKLDLKKYPLKRWRYAMCVEMEHGSHNKRTNVTKNNLVKTGKIALAHVIEFPDYYERLEKMEKKAYGYWKSKKRPSLLKK